jgi:hypothetical protein
MKYIIWAVAIILCFFLGRVMYSPLGPALLAQPTNMSAANERPTVVFGSGSSELRITIDLTSVSDREMPTTVELKKRALVAASDGSGETPLESGTTVTVRKRNGLNLEISAGGPLTGLVRIEDTDFTERVVEYRARRHFGTALAETPSPAPAPPSPTPTLSPSPTPPPAVVSNPTPTPTPPEPAPAPEPEPEPAALNEEQIVAAMKASVSGGAIKEFAAEQVQAWKIGDEEIVDGETYQTGLAAYKAETIFGPKTVQAKALIKGGKVVKWIYAKTGMEIR